MGAWLSAVQLSAWAGAPPSCTRRCALAVHKQTKTQQMQRAHLMLMSGRREHVLVPLLAVLGSRWKGRQPMSASLHFLNT